ncbi:hypothetical protein Y032_0051g2102 [Ancylostoma ceylanicum]|nr:hypothetical protein Y032_0051g2102 [Ancylostoma ceylanicum]
MALDYARTLVQIERLCENPEAARSNFNYSLDISLAEALERPHLCCSRTPHASEYDHAYVAKMVLMNMGNMSGTLSYDLHIRRF